MRGRLARRPTNVWILATTLLLGLQGTPAVGAEVESTASLDRSEAGLLLRVEVKGTLDYPLSEVRAVLLDIDGFRRWFPAVGAWQILEQSEGSTRVHGSQPLPWPVRDRDYVVLYQWRDLADGGFTLEALAEANALPAAKRRVIRVEQMRTLWTLAAKGERTLTHYVYEGDPGMALPDWLVRARWQSHTNAVVEELAREVERRRSPDR